MELGLKGRVALLTAAGSGLGKACASALAAEGAHVVISDVRQEAIDKTTAEIASQTTAHVLGIRADITSNEDVKKLVDATVSRLGSLDILVVSTGFLPKGQLLDLPDEDWGRGLDMALLSAVRLSRAALPHMLKRQWGRILLLTSTSVKQPLGEMAMSSVGRIGVAALSKLIANQYSSQGICAHTVCPGPFLTEGQRDMIADMAAKTHVTFDEAEREWIRDIPVGRHGRPEELGALVAFLASERASYMTGNAIQIDGGRVQSIV